MFYHQYILHMQDFLANIFHIYYMQDLFEISIFISITYKFLSWLKQDHTKHLVLYAYAYMTLLTISFYLECANLFSTMLFTLPVLLIFCMIIHQKQLQKNFISSSKKSFTPATTPHKNWIESLIQSCLVATHHKKNIICIIERNDNLENMLEAPFLLELPIQQNITNLILSSTDLTTNSILWTHASGTIQSVNVAWSSFIKNEILVLPQTAKSSPEDDAALLLSQKTDAIIFSLSLNEQHKVWFQGKCIQHITVQQIMSYIKEIIKQKSIQSSTIYKKGDKYDQNNYTS